MLPAPLVPYDRVAYTYVGATNNIATAVYKIGGSAGKTVCTQTFTYAAAGAANDDLVTVIATTY